MYVDSLEIRHVFLACVGPCNLYYKLIQMVGHIVSYYLKHVLCLDLPFVLLEALAYTVVRLGL